MKFAATTLTALGLIVASAPAFAAAHAMDPQEVNCAEYLTMDDEGKMALATAAAGDVMTGEEAMSTLEDNCRADDAAGRTVQSALYGE